MKNLFSVLALGGALASFGWTAQAATITSAGSGFWGSTSTWVGGVVPGAGDDVVIAAGTSVTNNTAAGCHSLTLNHGPAASGATLIIPSGNSLLVGDGTGSVTVGTTLGTPASQPSSTYTTVLNVAGSLTCGPVNLYAHRRSSSPGRNANAVLRLSDASAVVIVSGDLVINADSNNGGLNAGVEFTAAGLLKVGGSVTATNPTFTAGAGSVDYYAGGSQTMGNFTYNNLTLSGTGAKSGTVTVNGTLDLKDTATYSGTVTYGASATLKYSGSTAQSSATELKATVPNITINNANGVTFNSAVTVTGTLALNAGNVTAGANVVTIGAAGAVNRTSGHVIGSIQKTFLVGANVAQTFEVGTASGYNPAAVVITNVTAGGSLTVGAVAGDHPSATASALLAAQSVNVYWTVKTNGTLTFDAPASVTLAFNNPADLDGGVNTANLEVGKFDNGTWSYPEYELSGDSLIAHNLSGFSDFILAVEGTATTTTLAVSPGTRVIGDISTVYLTATVSPNPGGGKVVFTVDGTPIATNDVVSGQAQYALNSSGLGVGSHAITASFTSFGVFTGSTDDDTLTITPADTTTGVAANINPSVYGQSISITATVSITAPGSAPFGGTVTFAEGITTLADSLSVNGDGQASFSISGLSVGSHIITATYSGNGNLNGSSSTFTQIVDKASTDTDVTSSLSPIAAGENVTFTATVIAVSPGAGLPTGNVTFKEGMDILAGPVALDSFGKATFSTNGLLPGAHTITAEYDGDANFTASTGNMVQTITTYSTTNTVDPVVVFYQTIDQDIVITVHVNSAAVVEGGTVSLSITNAAGAVITNSVAVNVTNGLAVVTCALPGNVNVGTYFIVATYSGAPDFTGNSGVGTLTINPAPTTVEVPEVVMIVGSDSVSTFAAVIASNAVVNGGTVNFQLRRPSGGGMPIFNKNGVPVVNGIASVTFDDGDLAGLSVTNYILRVTYVAGANFIGSTTDGVFKVIPEALTPVVTLTSSVNPSYLGQTVIFTATVSGSGSTPTGTLQFTVNGGANTLPFELVSGTATYTNVFTSAATYNIGATYSGDAVYVAASTNLSQSVLSVNPADLKITLNGSHNALLTFTGHTNQTYHVETTPVISTNIVWISLGPVTSTTGTFTFEDTETGSFTNRFYRIATP